MDSAIVRHLKPEFEPVAVVWSNTIPDDALQFKKGRFGCILYLFAEAARRGKVAGGNRESIACNGGRAAMGLGVDFDASEESLDRYAAVFSKGLKSTGNQKAYRAMMEAAPRRWRALFGYGERRHCTAELATEWIRSGLPRYDIAFEYVLFKPLSRTAFDENVRAIIFPVNPVELSGLVTLAGSVMPGTDPVQVPQGADCNRIAAFAYAQADLAEPRAVMGMLDVDGREVMRKRFRDDVLTLTLPMPLYLRMEQEADDSVFQTPSWQGLVDTRLANGRYGKQREWEEV
ncbi:hypothetical protein D3OALGA1CA_1924 [Olavius algarvensis associated proteobacterium Delta 3]|nr:hypothetical protein D3OALGA1CA_1924 [Olavius algarvensis associated proteobacterium Delta 3]CAB5118407.1 hypothetical protein D3OALGB2SA_2817 [Olavius algarvensis associated proteobacterium Delta 3]